VLATGTSDKQVIAIADSVKSGLKKFGKVLDIEGAKEGKWVVIDYGDVIVHAFLEDMRAYYDLDDLWSNAEKVTIPEEYQWEHREPLGSACSGWERPRRPGSGAA